MRIVPSQDVIGAEIDDLDLGQPLSDDEFGRIESAFNTHSVICFREQHRFELRNHTYFFFDGMFLEPRLGSYFVVRAPIGARVPFLPAGYVTFYLGPRRYFFVNATYYLWDPDEYDYVVVDEPAGADAAMAAAEEEGDADGLFVYPSQGQSEEQLRQDRFECHEWAVSQTGYDPTLAAPGSKGRADYLRAMTACLEGRGYTVK